MVIKNYLLYVHLVLFTICINPIVCVESPHLKTIYPFIAKSISENNPTSQTLTIVDFESKYTDFIKTQFEENFDLLIGPSARKSFSIDYLLEKRRCLPGTELVTIKIALKDSTPIGFSIYNFGQYNDTLLIPDQEEGSIDVMCIAKDFRNKGYASQLLSHTLDALKNNGITRIILGVHNYNDAAINLYKKFGFTFLRSNDPCDDIYELILD